MTLRFETWKRLDMMDIYRDNFRVGTLKRVNGTWLLWGLGVELPVVDLEQIVGELRRLNALEPSP